MYVFPVKNFIFPVTFQAVDEGSTELWITRNPIHSLAKSENSLSPKNVTY